MAGVEREADGVSYKSLLAVQGMPKLLSGALLGRIAGQMLSVSLVLFTLRRFHSPGAAGLVVFAAYFPGLLFAPFAGALLDRHSRAFLIVLDYLVAAGALVLIVILSVAGVLSVALLVAIAAISSLTNPLSNAGTRTLLPLLLRPRMWDRANALDSTGFVIAMIVGPALAGALAGAINPSASLVAGAIVFVSGAVVLTGIPDPQIESGQHGGMLAEAWAGLRYVARHRTLRGLALGLSASNLGYGLAIVAMPVLVIDRLNGSPGIVGALWACVGIAGAGSGLLVGHLGSQGRERSLLISGISMTAVAGTLLAVTRSLAIATLALVIFGIANGPIDIAMFSMRQRRTERMWLGRVFAISAALNFSGVPLGSLLAGPAIAVSVTTAFAAMAGAQLVALACIATIPSRAPEHTFQAAGAAR